METLGTWFHNLLLDTFCSDQSLFGWLGGSCEMSLVGVGEVRVRACVWLGVFNVRFIYLTCWVQIHIAHWLGVSRRAISYYL